MKFNCYVILLIAIEIKKTTTEDHWSCKRSPDHFPGITTTVKREKGATSIFRCSRAAYSVVPDWIWQNFELIQVLMYVIVTCKYENDLIKNSKLPWGLRTSCTARKPSP